MQGKMECEDYVFLNENYSDEDVEKYKGFSGRATSAFDEGVKCSEVPDCFFLNYGRKR